MSMKTSKASLKIVSVILVYVLCVMAAPAGRAVDGRAAQGGG